VWIYVQEEGGGGGKGGRRRRCVCVCMYVAAALAAVERNTHKGGDSWDNRVIATLEI
jgi:hypothetical protein